MESRLCSASLPRTCSICTFYLHPLLHLTPFHGGTFPSMYKRRVTQEQTKHTLPDVASPSTYDPPPCLLSRTSVSSRSHSGPFSDLPPHPQPSGTWLPSHCEAEAALEISHHHRVAKFSFCGLSFLCLLLKSECPGFHQPHLLLPFHTPHPGDSFTVNLSSYSEDHQHCSPARVSPQISDGVQRVSTWTSH